MLSTLSKTDDLEKKWPKEELLLVLGFPVRTRNVLVKWYWEDEKEISLKGVMEVVVSDDKDPRPGYIISRLIGLRNVGDKNFWICIEQLNKLDLGKNCNRFWNIKYDKLMSAYRVKGLSSHSWSIPVTEKGIGYSIQTKKKRY